LLTVRANFRVNMRSEISSWKKIKQQDTHLHYFPTFEALTEKVEQALLKFTHTPEEILALCSLPTELAQAA
jgi:hypothetical protein